MADGVPFPRFLIRIPSVAAKQAYQERRPARGRRPPQAARQAAPRALGRAEPGSARRQPNRRGGLNANDCKASLSGSAGTAKRLLT